MAALLVTYSLNNPQHNYSNFFDSIESYPWRKLSESSYAIRTQQSPKEIFEALGETLSTNDSLYVITLKRPYFGHGPQEVNSWLKTEL